MSIRTHKKKVGLDDIVENHRDLPWLPTEIIIAHPMRTCQVPGMRLCGIRDTSEDLIRLEGLMCISRRDLRVLYQWFLCEDLEDI